MAETIFSIKGPYKVPTHPGAASKLVSEDISSFWAEAKDSRNKLGCYVFGIRAGKGLTPLYVGKTTKSFEQECFTDHKINHYNYALSEYDKGTPVIFFVEYPIKRGKPSSSEISDLEDFLIQVGRRVNPDLRNIKGARKPTWGIKGVIRGGKGKSNIAEKNFCTLFNL